MAFVNDAFTIAVNKITNNKHLNDITTIGRIINEDINREQLVQTFEFLTGKLFNLSSLNSVYYVEKEDLIIPVCKSGLFKSQILFNYLCNLKNALSTGDIFPQNDQNTFEEINISKTGICSPFGTMFGYDKKTENKLSDDNYIDYLFETASDGISLDDVKIIHNHLFGTYDVKQLGNNLIKNFIKEINLNKHNNFEKINDIRNFINNSFIEGVYKYLFNYANSHKKVIFIVFDDMEFIIIKKLLQIMEQTENTLLKNFIIISINYENLLFTEHFDYNKKLNEINTYFVNLYNYLSTKLIPYLPSIRQNTNIINISSNETKTTDIIETKVSELDNTNIANIIGYDETLVRNNLNFINPHLTEFIKWQIEAYNMSTKWLNDTSYIISQNETYESIVNKLKIQEFRDYNDDKFSANAKEFINTYNGKLYLVAKNDLTFKFPIYATDFVIPVCHVGQNRSQILYRLLINIKLMLGVKQNKEIINDPTNLNCSGLNVSCAHGAESGFDPHTAYKNLSQDNFYQYLYTSIDTDNNTLNVFKYLWNVDKISRLGEKLIASDKKQNLNPSESAVDFKEVETTRQFMRNEFNTKIYQPLIQYAHNGNKIVILAFMRGGPIILNRLLENVKNSGVTNLSNIHIICLNIGDPTNTASDRTLANNIIREFNDNISTQIATNISVARAFKKFYQHLSEIIIPRKL